MKKWFFLLLMGVSLPVFALLPPLYTTLNEFKTLVENPELTQKLDSGEVIISIRRTHKGFVVITNKHILFADVEPLHTGKIGPAEIQLKFHDPIERSALPSK